MALCTHKPTPPALQARKTKLRLEALNRERERGKGE
jgi:hypothetical protein